MTDPKHIGPYKIVSSLGMGGMGAVYLAHYKRQPRKLVAIKVLHPNYRTHAEAKKRFVSEIESLLVLQHPNIVPLLDFNTEGDTVWFAMPYFARGTLKDALRQGKRFTLGEVARLLSQVADAIDYAHEQKYLHRDIKPENILLDDHGNAILTDFGVAKHEDDDNLTNPGYALGTPKYMSRARKTGAPATRKTDVYALGVIIYQLLSGDLQLLQLDETWLYGTIPTALTDVVSKAVAEREDDTFESAGDFARAFEAVLDEPRRNASPNAVGGWAEALARTHSTSTFATPRLARGVVEAISRSVQISSPLEPTPPNHPVLVSIILGLCSVIVLGVIALMLTPEFDFLSIFEEGTREQRNDLGVTAPVTQNAQAPTFTASSLPTSIEVVSATPINIVLPTIAPTFTFSATASPTTLTSTSTFTASPLPPTETLIPTLTPSPTPPPPTAIPTLTPSPTLTYYVRRHFPSVSTIPYDMISLPSTVPCTPISSTQPENCDGKTLWIDVAPISAVQYQMCVTRGVCPRSANFSISGVASGLNWLNVAQFCAWRGGRLPTDVEIKALLVYAGTITSPTLDEWLGVDRQGPLLLVDVASQRAAIWDRTNPFRLNQLNDEAVSVVRNLTFRCVIYN